MRTHKEMIQALLLTGCMLVMGSLNAETVALWKLDTEPTDTAFNTRCMIDPANDLYINGNKWKGSAVPGWEIPPNPDVTSNMLDDAVNRNSLGLSQNGYSPYTSLQSDTFASKINITNSFTVEGWLFRTANPGTWQYVVGTHNGGAGRWILSLRNISGLKWIFYCAGHINDVAFPVPDSTSTTNMWRHIALTYDHDAGISQRGVWELFIDSQSYGTLTNANPVSSLTTSDDIFYLGGRATAANMATEAPPPPSTTGVYRIRFLQPTSF